MRTALARRDETGIGTPSAGAGAQSEDAALLKRLASGDGDAFRTVTIRFLPQLLALARRMLRDDSEAEDVVQEALVRLWRNAGTLELGPHGLRPWLRRVVSNLSIDRLRSSMNTSLTDEVPETPVAATQVSTLEEREMAARVDHALRALPDRQRAALTLFHYEGLSQIEVGRMLGISDEAVESLLARARRSLKAVLKDEWRALLPSKEER